MLSKHLSATVTCKQLIADLYKIADPTRVSDYQRFFKTGPGEYGEGDIFIGVTVPKTRLVAKKYYQIDLNELIKALRHKNHEVRLAALIIARRQYEKGTESTRKAIFDTYIANMDFINNWDLIDLSAPTIVGGYLYDKPRDILYTFTKSKNLWKRRVAIMATAHYVNKGEFEDTIKIAKIYLNDEHDLIHKATGWMLREIGKRDITQLYNFLDQYSKLMPRTMLRYSIEKLDQPTRAKYMAK